jgi:hypothetical protein
MIVIIAISFFVILVAAFGAYRRRLRLGATGDRQLAPSRFEGLFAHQVSALEPAELGNAVNASAARTELIERSRGGDQETLSEANSTGDAVLYGEVLDGLIEATAGSQESFAALLSRISKSNELRANKRLAQLSIDSWKTSPDRRSTAQMLHIAALSDDSTVYEQAVELVFEYWQRGSLEQYSGEELVALFESQYWILAPEARRGGAGFALKRRLAGIRRELATASVTR